MVALWWIGNVIFVLVIIPVVVVLLRRLMSAIFNIGKHVDTIHGQVEGLVVAVDDVKQLIPTQRRESGGGRPHPLCESG
jgi:uncharacterized membrane protein